MSKQKVKDESKQGKFKRIASARTQRILEGLRLLGNCSNSAVYGYSSDEANKIFLAIDKELKRVKTLFKKSKVEFSFD